jgi:hypothetical protein
MPTNYTPEMLAALEAAIATGAMVVWYGTKKVEYRSLNDMYRIRDNMRQELGLNTDTSKGKVYATFSKGIK